MFSLMVWLISGVIMIGVIFFFMIGLIISGLILYGIYDWFTFKYRRK